MGGPVRVRHSSKPYRSEREEQRMSLASATLTRLQNGRVLVASSRSEVREKILKNLSPATLELAEAAGGADALIKLEENDFHTLVLDPQLDDLDVGELVSTIRGRYPRLNVVLLDRHHDPEQLALDLHDRSGWEEIEAEPPIALATAALSEYPPEISTTDLPRAAAIRIEPLLGMIGTGLKMQQIYRLALLVAPRDTAVLIVGATGTGKELVARGIHELSRRSRGPFVVVNCAAIPESLLEAELFGFTRGAFTGAFQSRLGRIHAAHGGTLLLDEVGELPLSMQAKLLRFVQEGEVQRLGSADLFRVNARLIAATNADLLQRVRERLFREDLYYRLAVFPIDLPPLRNRSEDILPLAQHFLLALCEQAGTVRKVFSFESANLVRNCS